MKKAHFLPSLLITVPILTIFIFQTGMPVGAQKLPRRVIASLQTSNNSEGSRVTITSDVTLSDYSAYQKGERFYVIIPQADASSVNHRVRGRSFSDSQIEQRGNEAVFSFLLLKGVTTRVNQRFNRLDITFTMPSQSNSDVASNNLASHNLTPRHVTGRVVPSQEAAQTKGVEVSGTVEDQAGAVISSAKVLLHNKITGEEREDKADDSGNFRLKDVQPGQYSITSEAPGFNASTVAMTVGLKPVTDIKLKMTININEEVTVTDTKSRVSVASENNADKLNFDDDLLRDLPLPTRSKSLFDFIGNFLSPAAAGTDELTVIVDGVEATQFNLPTFAIRRVLINSNPFSVEYRRPGKARVEIVTQDGSRRRYHGGVGFTYHNSIFDARNAFAVTKPDLAQRQYEASFSGPFIHKRASFFLSVQRQRSDDSAIVNAITLAGPFRQNVPTGRRFTYGIGRIDVRPNQVHTLSMRYDFGNDIKRNIGVGDFSLPEQGTDNDARIHRIYFSDRAIVSANFLNDARFVFEREQRRTGRFPAGPAIEVADAFVGGFNQNADLYRAKSFEFRDIANYYHGRHTVRFGGRFRPKFINVTDASDFGGLFEFAGLEQFTAGRPEVFTVRQGQPAVSFRHHEAEAFFQDEFRLRPNLSLTAGLRYDWQSAIDDFNNFAPRLSFAWAPGQKQLQKTVIRGGFGIFYERLPERVTQRRLLLNGERIREVVISHPSFPNPFQSGQNTSPLPSVVRVAPDLQAPYEMLTSISLERQLRPSMQLTVEYANLRGFHLFRARNVNAPLPGTSVRPNPNFLNIKQVESSAILRSNALSFTYRARIRKFLRASAIYTLSKSENDTAGAEPGAGFPFTLPVNNFDLRPEFGRANFDQRHRFNFAGTFDLPLATRIGAVLTLASGTPFNITTGFDDNRDTVVNDRPFGIRRNTGQNTGFQRLDLRFTKLFSVPRPFDRREHKTKNLELNVDAINVFNHLNFGNTIGTLSSPFFGRANSARDARTIQFSTKYSF